MSYNHEYPYVDPDVYNADWLLNEMKRVAHEWRQVQQEWSDQESAFENLKEYIRNYFKNLDVSEEISNKINEMVESGEFIRIISPELPPIITKWISENLEATSPPVDKTLTIEGAAADAKVVGDIGMLYRGVAAGVTKIGSLKGIGSYSVPKELLSNLTDLPEGIDMTSNYTLLNIEGYQTGLITQYLWETSTLLTPYARTYNTISNIPYPWTQNYNPATVYNYHGRVNPSKLSDLTKVGSYGITTANTSNISDLPSGFTPDNILLFNMEGFVGNILVQQLYTTSFLKRPWVRYVNRLNGSASAWEQASDDKYNYVNNLEGSGTTLAGLTKLGSYRLTRSVISNMTDLPSGALEDNYTLLNIEGFVGGYVTQYLWNTSIIANPYVRYCTVSGTDASRWEQFGIYSPEDATFQSRWTVIGDSFTSGDFTGVEQPIIPSGRFAGYKATYPYWIGNRLNINITDLSKGGLKLGGSDGFAATMLSQIHAKSEWITIALGINDENYNTPIGTRSDTTPDTFYGAWNVLMAYLYNNFPTAHIGIIVTNGMSNSEYINVVKEMAEYWCVPYLDMAEGTQVPTLNRSAKTSTDHASLALSQRNKAFNVSTTNTHPNGKAHKYESVFIGNWLLTI